MRLNELHEVRHGHVLAAKPFVRCEVVKDMPDAHRVLLQKVDDRAGHDDATNPIELALTALLGLFKTVEPQWRPGDTGICQPLGHRQHMGSHPRRHLLA